MKNKTLTLLIIIIPFVCFAESNKDKFFGEGMLRFDYVLSGNSDTANITQVEIKKESGTYSLKNLVAKFNYGTYRFRVLDHKTSKLIYSRGFCPIFQEWQFTEEAKHIDKIFYQVLRFPFPVASVKLLIDYRHHDGEFRNLYSTTIEPENYFIIDETLSPIDFENILYNGKPEKKVDIAILAEGYTEKEMGKFISDSQRLTNTLFSSKPFKEMKKHFNVYALKSISLESGTDIPAEGIYKNTIFNSTFYTFDISRYLTTSDMKSIHDVAANVPYDQIYILVNTDRYGGGGFYNQVCVCTSDNDQSGKVFIHEFGHGFAGLADEYYTSKVAYIDYYNMDIEPWEANITTLVDFKLKWKNMIKKSTPIPTLREYDYKNKAGAFEGGGYISRGMYSPYQNCIMKSIMADELCPVCQKAIIEVIKTYIKPK
jgi:hypothetical protein